MSEKNIREKNRIRAVIYDDTHHVSSCKPCQQLYYVHLIFQESFEKILQFLSVAAILKKESLTFLDVPEKNNINSKIPADRIIMF